MRALLGMGIVCRMLVSQERAGKLTGPRNDVIPAAAPKPDEANLIILAIDRPVLSWRVLPLPDRPNLIGVWPIASTLLSKMCCRCAWLIDCNSPIACCR